MAVFHAYYSPVSGVPKVLEDVLIIDFARQRLFSARGVAHLNVRYFRARGVKVCNEVPLGDLLVVQVVENLAVRAVDRLADCIGLRNSL